MRFSVKDINSSIFCSKFAFVIYVMFDGVSVCLRYADGLSRNGLNTSERVGETV